MTVIKENLKRIWDCLVAKAPEITSLLQPGLKRQEIDEITKDLPWKLPEEVYELYQWRNGLSKEIGLYGWKVNEIAIFFDSLETAVQCIKKVILDGAPVYFLIFFWFSHENGGDFFTVPLGKKISPVIALYDEDACFNYFIEYFDSNKELVCKPDSNHLFESVKLREQNDLFKNRTKYNNIGNSIEEIADCCEQGFESLEINENGYISVFLNKEKCRWIHYRHRFCRKNMYCLTLKQEAELYDTKQRWLNVINTPLNQEKAARAIRELYAYAGEKIPEIVFIPSFYNAHLGVFGKSYFLEQTQNISLASKLKSLYWDFLLLPFDYLLAQPVITSILMSLKSEFSVFLDNVMEDDLRKSIETLFKSEVSPDFKNIIDLLYSALKYDLKETLGENFIWSHLNYKYILGCEDFISSAALFEFAHFLGIEFDEQKLNLFVLYCREVWCVIPFDKTILVCEKPQITWREHSYQNFIQQPDITFSDGYRI